MVFFFRRPSTPVKTDRRHKGAGEMQNIFSGAKRKRFFSPPPSGLGQYYLPGDVRSTIGTSFRKYIFTTFTNISKSIYDGRYCSPIMLFQKKKYIFKTLAFPKNIMSVLYVERISPNIYFIILLCRYSTCEAGSKSGI